MKEYDHFRTVDNEQILKVNEIYSVMKQEQDEFNRHQILYNLTREELAYQIRQNVAYPWADFWIEGAARWLSMRDKKLDKRRRYDEQEEYKQFNLQLARAFQVDTVEVLDIHYWGFDVYGHTVVFKTDEDFVWILGVPVIKKISPKNMEESNYGKIKFGYMQNSSCYYYVKSSYTLSDFSETMRDCIEESGAHWSIQEYLTKEK